MKQAAPPPSSQWPGSSKRCRPPAAAASTAMATRLHTAAALLFAALLAYGLLRLARFIASYVRIARGLSSVPEAPHGHWLLGHVLPLLRGTAWDLMAEWVAEQPHWSSVVKLRIMQRHMVVVGSAEGVKRVFQVGTTAPACPAGAGGLLS